MEDFFKVGIIASTHGLKGEVKVYPTTDDVRRFKRLKKVTLAMEKVHSREGVQSADPVLEIESVKFFKQFAILKESTASRKRSGTEKLPLWCPGAMQCAWGGTSISWLI